MLLGFGPFQWSTKKNGKVSGQITQRVSGTASTRALKVIFVVRSSSSICGFAPRWNASLPVWGLCCEVWALICVEPV